jgi:hypothetical protein
MCAELHSIQIRQQCLRQAAISASEALQQRLHVRQPLLPEHENGGEIPSSAPARTVREEKLRIAAGTQVRNGYIFRSHPRPEKILRAGSLEIELKAPLSILRDPSFPVKLRPEFFRKALLKTADDISADFIAVLADRGADGRHEI